MAVLVTGAAGFIGYHVCAALLARGENVIGVDMVNDYYDVALKEARLAKLDDHANFSFRPLIQPVGKRIAILVNGLERRPFAGSELSADDGVHAGND